MVDGYEIALLPGSARGFIVPRRLIRDHDGRGPIELDRGPGDALPLRGSIRRLSHVQARILLRAAAEDPWSAHRIFTLVARTSGLALHHEDLIEAAARLLASGRYVLVQVVKDRPGGAAPAARETPEPEPSEPLTKLPSPDTTALRVRVVLDDGVPVAGAAVTLSAPDGQLAELTTSGSGEAELAEVAHDGIGRAVVYPAKIPRWRRGADIIEASERYFDFPFDASIAADIPTATTCTIVLRRPEVLRIDGARLGFAPDSPLLVPLADDLAPLQALATALARLRDDPSLRLLIVGHASPDGSAKTNDALALRRAQCTRHLLAADRDAWIDLAAEHGSPADIQKLLRYLARVHDWPTEPTRVDGVVDRPVEAAVSSFQATYNAIFGGRIIVDGVIGRETLGALFDVQRHELRYQLAALDVADAPPRWYGAGVASLGPRVLAHPGIPGSQAADGQRRVDLLLLPDTLTWNESHGLERLYDVARLQPVPIAPLPVGPADIVLQIVDHYGRILAGEPYRLFTDEDERVGTSDDQGTVIERGLRGRCARLECGEAILVFDDLYSQRTKQRYALAPAPLDLDDDDEPWSDAPLPARDDDDDDDDDPVFDFDDDEPWADAPLPARDDDDDDDPEFDFDDDEPWSDAPLPARDDDDDDDPEFDFDDDEED